ncbi:O-antigen ligase family protein [Mycobacterium hodleri]|uniref:O-antigen ligase family protein n=1 Tax=Mycolicibacterium hodleri TaxID=49897 RepID=UPI0021F3A29D|nr:O-antigen ligase family protein [Mycolicibacterium hodleri]MCV7135834.1 O-antigen ligase family protein [Mycolicibacterium hodleri]
MSAVDLRPAATTTPVGDDRDSAPPTVVVVATVALLVAMFLRIPVKALVSLPVELFLIAFVALGIALVLWLDCTRDRLRGIGVIGWAMTAYVAWNVYSMLAPHRYPATDVLLGAELSIPRLIVIGVMIPFSAYVVGRYAFDRVSAVRALLWTVLALTAYSAAVSIMPFTGLADWVWPRYVVVVERPGWAGRAVGIFNQPVINGMVLALGFATAMLVLTRRSEPRWQRVLALVIGVAAGVGLYETRTRAAWLGGLAVLVIGALLAKGSRHWYVTVLGALTAFVAVNWSTFTSADREAGGVGSQAEVESRLNDIQTALWAFVRKPLEGWGIGRFQAVNSYHHQQWTPDTVWSAGLGEVSHENELAILAELGVIGLIAYLGVLALVARRLWRAYGELPDHDVCGKPLVILSAMALAIMVLAGMTVDLRYFDFSTTIIFLIVGVTVGWADRAVSSHRERR